MADQRFAQQHIGYGTQHIRLSGEHFTGFIDAKVKEGRYTSASDVVRAGLRLLEEEEAKLERLRAEIEKGLASGPGEPWDLDAFLAEKRSERSAH